MRYFIFILIFCSLLSCAEELIKKPEELISEDQMVEILKEMALLNAAKGTNVMKLEENGIDPTTFIFDKFKIDSAQFVDNDRYYASLPLVYERIYKRVESKLGHLEEEIQAQKKINDSLHLLKRTEIKGAQGDVKGTVIKEKPQK